MAFKKELIRELESFGKVVHTAFSDPDAPRAYQRDNEIETLIRLLTADRRSSTLVVGPSGIGKTSMIHELARRLAFRGSGAWMMLETSTSVLMSGTVYSGEWQTRFHDIWPREEGGRPVLMEEYTYLDLKLNVGLTDADFSQSSLDYLGI